MAPLTPIAEAEKEDIDEAGRTSFDSTNTNGSIINRLMLDMPLSNDEIYEDDRSDSGNDDSMDGSTQVESISDEPEDLKEAIAMAVIHHMSEDGPTFRFLTKKVKTQTGLIASLNDEVVPLKKQLQERNTLINSTFDEVAQLQAYKYMADKQLWKKDNQIQELKEEVLLLKERLTEKDALLSKKEDQLQVSERVVHTYINQLKWKDWEIKALQERETSVLLAQMQTHKAHEEQCALKEQVHMLGERLESKRYMLKTVEGCIQHGDDLEMIRTMVAECNKEDKETFYLRPKNPKLLEALENGETKAGKTFRD